ncbi:MAG: hypothetical protein LBK95_06900 [Bifidobacteriaceae bacterium]|jgi:hypothetical protein|nr:hypothetical protein [Bifidobacteriaceae bacterium]
MTTPLRLGKRLAIAAAFALILVALTGCLGSLAMQNPLTGDRAADPDPPAEPLSIDGTEVWLDGATVESECFTFELPEGYELGDFSRDCHASIGYPPDDSLTAIEIGVSYNPVDEADWREVFDSGEGGTLSHFEPVRFQGLDGFSANLDQSFGLSYGWDVIFIPDDRFVTEGHPITATVVRGYRSDPLDPVFAAIWGTLKIKV